MVQDVIVTLVALVALGAVAWPMWRRAARGASGACPNCASGETCAPGAAGPRDQPDVRPLTFVGGRGPSGRR